MYVLLSLMFAFSGLYAMPSVGLTWGTFVGPSDGFLWIFGLPFTGPYLGSLLSCGAFSGAFCCPSVGLQWAFNGPSMGILLYLLWALCGPCVGVLCGNGWSFYVPSVGLLLTFCYVFSGSSIGPSLDLLWDLLCAFL